MKAAAWGLSLKVDALAGASPSATLEGALEGATEVAGVEGGDRESRRLPKILAYISNNKRKKKV